jgi:hypothetical protein
MFIIATKRLAAQHTLFRPPLYRDLAGRRPASTDTKFYDLLGIDKTANADAIKKAFRKAAMVLPS